MQLAQASAASTPRRAVRPAFRLNPPRRCTSRGAFVGMLRASGTGRSALLLLVRAVHAHAEAACAAPPPGVSAYPLLQKWPAGNQSYVLRFALPPEEGAMGWRGVKAFLDGEDEKTGAPVTLEKSYSPVSLPSVERSFDLLVKAYPPRQGGGVGAFLCGLEPGENAYLKLKPPRLIKGVPDVRRLAAEGTPCIQC